MSSLGDALARKRRGRAPGVAAAPAPGPPPASASEAISPPPLPAQDDRSELRRRRDELAEQVTELHWDLGGLTYEMATRDHFRLDVLVRRAAMLQERDAELAELERLLALQDSATAGSCPGCGAPHSRGAVFCWQCGATLMQQAPSTATPAFALPANRDDATVEIDALFARGPHAPGRRRGAAPGGAGLAEE